MRIGSSGATLFPRTSGRSTPILGGPGDAAAPSVPVLPVPVFAGGTVLVPAFVPIEVVPVFVPVVFVPVLVLAPGVPVFVLVVPVFWKLLVPTPGCTTPFGVSVAPGMVFRSMPLITLFGFCG